MNEVLFSVIMPAYNAEQYITESIESVLSQSYDNFEIVVINDGSIDNTATVVSEIADKRIRLFNKDNGGVSNARNFGIEHSRGKFICFLDSDDLWMENHLEVLNNLIKQNSTCSVFCTGYKILDFKNEYVEVSKNALSGLKEESIVINNYFKFQREHGNFVHINSLCVCKTVFDISGKFQPYERIGEDTDMLYRIVSRFDLVLSKKVTSVYRRNESSVTAKRSFNYNWSFLNHYQDLLADSTVKEEVKPYIKMFVEQYKVSIARNYLLEMNKGKAKAVFKDIDKTKVPVKYYYATKLLILLPSFVAIFAAKIRDRGYLKS